MSETFEDITVTKNLTSLQESKLRQSIVIAKVATRVLNVVCYDFSESDRQFLHNEICKQMPGLHNRGFGFATEITALIYLLSKCPANSDKPLQFNEVCKRCSTLPEYTGRTVLRGALSKVRASGAETCRITYEIAVRSCSDKLYEKAKSKGIPKIQVTDAIDRVCTILKDPKVRVICTGRNPYVVGAAVTYYCVGGITQPEISRIFNITTTSIRNVLSKFDKEYPDWKYIT